MNAYLFLYRKMWINRIRKLIKKPASLIYTIFIIAYFAWLIVMLQGWIREGGFGTPENLSRVLCAFTIYLSPANFASYARRKGLIFLPADVHFLFGSPLSPKGNLLYAYGKTLQLSLVFGAVMVPVGIFWFHVAAWKMALYFLVCVAAESVLEASIVLLLYGNERLGKGAVRIFGWAMYGLLACFVAIALFLLYRDGFRWDVVFQYLDSPWLCLVPIIGWSLAVMKLIVLGPSAVTVIGTVLYAVSFLLLVAMAARMRCTGQYYEDAEKFADDYQEAQRRNKTGEVAFVGKKKKYKTARVEYRGGGASAIFYRQLLEYKKERFFIFGFVTLVFLAGGLLTGWLTMREGDAMQSAVWRHYLIPGILMYLGFIFSGYKTRWAKELENPYVFLIPDSGFKKMWYATVIDHIRAAVHGLLFVVPAMIGMRISWWYLPVYLVMQVCMNAVFLYSNTVCRYLLGNVVGDTLLRSLHMIIAWLVILVALPIAILLTTLAGIAPGLLAGSLYLLILAVLLAWAGSASFVRMEQ